jgi:hypothetical protein
VRIICWNVRGRGPIDLNLSGVLDSWNADIAIFLEPPQWMRDGGDKMSLLFRQDRHQTPIASNWRLKGYDGGHTQGYVCVAYKKGNAKVTMQGVQVEGSSQDNRLVLITATVGTETRHIATCHVPFAQNSGEAIQYVNTAMKMIKRGFASVGVPRVDIWLGDFNTYGTTAPLNAQPEYRLELAKPTSNFGSTNTNHFPLDKIMVHVSVTVAACGRIVPATVPEIHQGNIADVTEASWTSNSKVPSDHLPIYLDTSMVVNPMPVMSSKLFDFPDPEPRQKKQKVN